MQVKKIIAYALSVCLLISAISVPAYAVDEVYSITDDAAYIPASVIYYTPDYYPGVVAEMRSSGLFANTIAHGSYSEMNYNPSWLYIKGSTYPSGDFNSIIPEVIADQSDVSAVYSIPNTDFLNGQMLTFNLPNTEDGYFDFQSSNFLFDQQSAQANTFYINGTLTFNLRNLWSFTGVDGNLNTKNASWYLASDPLAVQLVIDGKAYGDIIDVTGYTSPFTALYNGGVPTNASVTFNNLKVYYQGDTPDMIGFRVYTGSKFTNGQYNYGDFTAVGVTNTVTFRCLSIPDITFVQEGGDGYAGDLSGISGLLSDISGKLSQIFTAHTTGNTWLDSIYQRINFVLQSALSFQVSSWQYLSLSGTLATSTDRMYLVDLVRRGFVGLRSLMVDSSGNSYLDGIPVLESWIRVISDSIQVGSGYPILGETGVAYSLVYSQTISSVLRQGFLGLATLSRNAQSYVADTVFPWQSYNMETHQLNAATNIKGQNNLFFTAFQSMEDKLGRLAYVFGSDEDLKLKDQADPGTDAFRENFGGGLSLGQISDGKDVVVGVSGLLDSGYDFGDAFTEISGDSMFTTWFSSQNAAALDSTSSVMALSDDDPYNMQIYYDRIQEVTSKRDREEGDTNG